jgi:hypothetical protein
MLPTLRDVDDYRDATLVAAQVPHTNFAAAFTALRRRDGDSVLV